MAPREPEGLHTERLSGGAAVGMGACEQRVPQAAVVAPEGWSQLSVHTMVQKYQLDFRLLSR
eukprot:6184468-Pleurochrysis_carterae.AAC.2